MDYVYFALAVVTEVIATTAIKATEGFTKFWPSALVVAGYAASFYLFSQVMDKFAVGIAYAMWSGLGVVLVTLASWWLYKQEIDLAGWIGIVLIIAGVTVINMFSNVPVE
jgi:small multidrug resistance pump